MFNIAARGNVTVHVLPWSAPDYPPIILYGMCSLMWFDLSKMILRVRLARRSACDPGWILPPYSTVTF